MIDISQEELLLETVILFREIKLREKLIGYSYLVDAVHLRFKNPNYQKKIYGELFRDVANVYQVNKETVERDIRTLLESSWTNSYTEMRYVLYGEIIKRDKDKPTVAMFIEQTVKILEKRLLR